MKDTCTSDLLMGMVSFLCALNHARRYAFSVPASHTPSAPIQTNNTRTHTPSRRSTSQITPHMVAPTRPRCATPCPLPPSRHHKRRARRPWQPTTSALLQTLPQLTGRPQQHAKNRRRQSGPGEHETPGRRRANGGCLRRERSCQRRGTLGVG
jgi:hypothetical protein